MPLDALRAFADESSVVRSPDRQEYLIGAALIPAAECEGLREHVRSLALPGQVKLHWSDEGSVRRRKIVERLASLGPMTIVVTHLSERMKKNERCRRKCLETLYHDMIGMGVFDLTLEDRSEQQNKSDQAHIVALQGQGLDTRVRLRHLRGGDEPLLWIADALLGAINSAAAGESRYLDALEDTLLIRRRTADSLLA